MPDINGLPTTIGPAGPPAIDDDAAPVWATLRTVIDPELGINLVDLGLVYGVTVADGIAYVTLTVTTPACPIGTYLEDQVRWAALRLDGILGVEVTLVHEPPWTPALMSDDARQILGWAS